MAGETACMHVSAGIIVHSWVILVLCAACNSVYTKIIQDIILPLWIAMLNRCLSVHAQIGCLAHQLLSPCLLQRIPFSGAVKL